MVRTTLLLNVLVLLVVVGILLGVDAPGQDGLATAVREAIGRLHAWSADALGWTRAALDRVLDAALNWAARQLR
jgi:hypothetical protein